ncbi:MAG: hypothetical protein N3A59_05310 [Thermodesulfovibrionales bacterium]|nr:hypothetical protein [Thermodesulfovibrionales bacterium]
MQDNKLFYLKEALLVSSNMLALTSATAIPSAASAFPIIILLMRCGEAFLFAGSIPPK